MGPPDLSVIVPLYNEEENLPILAREIAAALAPTGLDYELIYVDDGSDDRSPDVLVDLARDDPRVRILRIRKNSGLSAGLAAGFRHARAPVVVTLDADLQNDPADIPLLLSRLASCDVVCGVRRKRRDDWLRRVSSRIANGIRNRVTEESISDVGCTLRAYRRELVREIPMFTGSHRFLPTLLKLAGARVEEVPVHHRPRLHGQPKYNLRNRIVKAFVDLWAVRWMQKRWIDRRLVEEVEVAGRRPAVLEEEESWTTRPSGSSSDSSAKGSSSAASSSSGSSRRSAAKA